MAKERAAPIHWKLRPGIPANQDLPSVVGSTDLKQYIRWSVDDGAGDNKTVRKGDERVAVAEDVEGRGYDWLAVLLVRIHTEKWRYADAPLQRDKGSRVFPERTTDLGDISGPARTTRADLHNRT